MTTYINDKERVVLQQAADLFDRMDEHRRQKYLLDNELNKLCLEWMTAAGMWAVRPESLRQAVEQRGLRKVAA